MDDNSRGVVSTGHLPPGNRVDAILAEAFETYRKLDEGEVATYIPSLASVPSDLFGAAMVAVDGSVSEVGDHQYQFSIQSVSKPFVFALVCDAIGQEEARARLGVNSTGKSFNSVMAIEMSDDRTVNPMVNAGAIATTSLAPGATAADKWDFVVDGLSRFAGRTLEVDPEVYASESANNRRNQGIAHLLDSYDRMYFDPDEATDVYTRQCSLTVSAHDLAVMGATLADGGVNPVTGEKVVEASTCTKVLAVLATSGFYERSGDWLYETGLPGKSGVSGGIVTIAPGKGGLGTFSPRLDPAGNSVRGQRLIGHLSVSLGLNLFASVPEIGDPDPT